MKNFTPFVFAFILFLSAEFFPQTGSLRGFVVDSLSNEALAFGNVYIKELQTGSSTNERGLYLIQSIPTNKNYTLIFSFVGYQTKEMNVFVQPGKITHLDVSLSPSTIQLQAVEKIGEKVIEKNATDIGLERLTLRELEALPKGVETDLFRSLQTISGVQSTGDVSARYYVRGGTSDQNLVQINGFTIYNPFHALGLFSVIDPEMINSVEFYKGGFPSEYGGRVSSVLNVITKDGNKNSFGFKGSSSFLTAKALIEGPFPGGSFMLTGRKSHSNKILKRFLNDQNVPIDFYDFSFKVNTTNPIIENGKLNFFGFFSSDKFKHEDTQREYFEWQNDIVGFEWLQIYDVPLYSRLGLSVSNFTGKLQPNSTSLKPIDNSLADVLITLDFTYVFDSKDEMSMGLKINSINTKLDISNPLGIKSSLEKFSGNLAVYGKYKLLRFDNFGFDFGTRFNVTGLTEDGGFSFEPRLNITYRITDEIKLKGAWGIYQQELTTLTDENEVISLFEPWIIIPSYLQPEISNHYIFGIDYDPFVWLNFSVEGYYKIVKNLPIINNKKFEAADPELISGKGESYGWDFNIKNNFYPFSVSASYSLSWAYKEVDNFLYYPKYDTRNSFSISTGYEVGAGWQVNATWVYHTGLPFTKITGYYDKFYFDTDDGIPVMNGYFSPFVILGDRNLGRLPEYHRLDINLSKHFNIGFAKFIFDISVMNVYDRANIFYYERDTGERVNMLPILPSATIKIEI